MVKKNYTKLAFINKKKTLNNGKPRGKRTSKV